MKSERTDLLRGVNNDINCIILLYCLSYGIFECVIDWLHELKVLKQKIINKYRLKSTFQYLKKSNLE